MSLQWMATANGNSWSIGDALANNENENENENENDAAHLGAYAAKISAELSVLCI